MLIILCTKTSPQRGRVHVAATFLPFKFEADHPLTDPDLLSTVFLRWNSSLFEKIPYLVGMPSMQVTLCHSVYLCCHRFSHGLSMSSLMTAFSLRVVPDDVLYDAAAANSTSHTCPQQRKQPRPILERKHTRPKQEPPERLPEERDTTKAQ